MNSVMYQIAKRQENQKPIQFTHVVDKDRGLVIPTLIQPRQFDKVERVHGTTETDIMVATSEGQAYLFFGHWNDGVI